jgi:hypothetical protein
MRFQDVFTPRVHQAIDLCADTPDAPLEGVDCLQNVHMELFHFRDVLERNQFGG